MPGADTFPTLRHALRLATAPQHDRLDALVGQLDLTDPDSYASFLSLQLAARTPIERWAARECPADLCPPQTAGLLCADLAELGRAPAVMPTPFAWPGGGDPRGLAWALAGSSMGNQAMLAQLRRAGAGVPTRFLEDRATIDFWRALKPRLEVPVDAADVSHAVAAARAVFAAFLGAAAALEPLAA